MMLTASRTSLSPADGMLRSRAASPAALRRPNSGAGIGRPSLAAAGLSMVSPASSGHQSSSRPESRESDDGDWRKEQRASIKKGCSRAPCRPEAADVCVPALRAPQDLPPLRAGVRGQMLQDRLKQEQARRDCELEAKRARSDAQAQASACWEDLISFLELHKLSGAYALAFSAYGVEDLTSLLLLEDAALASLLEKCNIDAMDEIMLLEALKKAKPC